MNNKKFELLAPAGDLEKLKVAVLYGADAVYLGGTSFGLRAKAKNFDEKQMKEGIDFAHSHGAKVYVTCNIYAHNGDFENMAEYFKSLEEMGADAILVADPGVFALARKTVPNLDIHISTQANNTNFLSALFWKELGAKRIVMARELSLEEIREISQNIGDTEIEAFVHGAMCISYSGRCLLSNYFTGRNANTGECAHPCRWKYYVTESTREGEYLPVVEEERGTYIFNSKDLCMIEHIPQLYNSGVYSLKIEGRMKTSFYVATVVKAYRQAIDDFLKDPALYEKRKSYYKEEVSKASYRGFTTGFYYGSPGSEEQVYTNSSYIREYDFLGIVLEYDSENKIAVIEQRNKFSVGDKAEFLTQKGESFPYEIEEIRDKEGNTTETANHARQIVKMKVDRPLFKYDILRKKAEGDESEA